MGVATVYLVQHHADEPLIPASAFLLPGAAHKKMPGLRSQALSKLARLGNREDFDRIADGCNVAVNNGAAGRVPMVPDLQHVPPL